MQQDQTQRLVQLIFGAFLIHFQDTFLVEGIAKRHQKLNELGHCQCRFCFACHTRDCKISSLLICLDSLKVIFVLELAQDLFALLSDGVKYVHSLALRNLLFDVLFHVTNLAFCSEEAVYVRL